MHRHGFTLVEVLIALALAMLVLLPSLGVFSAALKASGRSETVCRAHIVAEALVQTAVAGIRTGKVVDELRVVENPVRVVLRMRHGDDPATTTVSAIADIADGETHETLQIAFPALNSDDKKKPEVPAP